MTKEQAKEAAAVMLAWSEGKAIQCADHDRDNWSEVHWTPEWNWPASKYRIKPEPREWWLAFGINSDGQCSTIPRVHTNKVLSNDYCKVIHVREVLE